MSKGRYLIVGAAGQVGQQILSQWGEDHCIPTSREGAAHGWASLDLESLSAAHASRFLAEQQVDAVICCGGMTDVERCESEAGRAMAANCVGPSALADAACERRIPFVYFSSEYVFDGRNGPYVEESLPRPLNVYGRSKWEGECAVLEAHPGALIVRTTVVYGPDARGKNFLYGLRAALDTGRTIRVACDQVSTPIYNRGLAGAVLALVQANARGVFHICGPDRLSRYEFAVRAARAMGLNPSAIEPLSTAQLGQKAARPLNAGLSSEKLRRLYPDVPIRGIEDSIADWIKMSVPQTQGELHHA